MWDGGLPERRSGAIAGTAGPVVACARCSLTLDGCPGGPNLFLGRGLVAPKRGEAMNRIMKKIQIVWLALFAVFAFSAVAASSAFAEDTQWLWEGAKIAAELAVDTEGELLLEDSGASVKIDILCNGLFGGVVGGLLGVADPLLDEVNDIEDLHMNLDSQLDCEAETSCAEKLANVTAVNLPWKTELLLETHNGVSEFMDDFTSDNGVAGVKPGYTVDCIVLGVLVEDTCTGEPKALLENVTGGVLGTFDENAEINPPGECTLSSGLKEGLVIGTGLTVHTGGGTLAVSEE